MVVLNVGLDAWIIQDGNYGDFTLGEEVRFALEFLMVSQAEPRDTEPQLRIVRGAEYDFDGRVVLCTPEFTVLDAGILVYREGGPDPQLAMGSRLSGRLYLGIDPFPWFETHAHRSGVPNLFHRWIVREILLDDAVSFRPVSKTDAWTDDSRYILRVERLGAG